MSIDARLETDNYAETKKWGLTAVSYTQLSVELAINQGVLKGNTIIVDSTHTEARYHKTTQREILKKASTSLKAALKDSDKDIYITACPSTSGSQRTILCQRSPLT